MEELVFFAALLVFVFGLFSAVAGKSPIMASMVYVTVGIHGLSVVPLSTLFGRYAARSRSS